MIYQNLELYNVADVYPAEDGNGLRLSRFPEAVRKAVNPGCQAASLHGAGCEVRLNLKPGGSVRISLQTDPTHFPWEKGGIAEIFHGSFYSFWQMVGQSPCEFTVQAPARLDTMIEIAKREKHPYDPALVRIVLPYRPSLRLLKLEGDWEPPRPEQAPSKRLLIYGTSISHGAWSIHPSATYAMRLARLAGADLINLGFGGSAWYEPAVADYLAARTDWNALLLESHNLKGKIEPKEFRARVDYFLKTITAAHPDKPLYCTSLFALDELHPDLGNPRIRALRRAMQQAVAALGRPNVRFIPIRKSIRMAGDLTADLVHPAPLGEESIAAGLAKIIRF